MTARIIVLCVAGYVCLGVLPLGHASSVTLPAPSPPGADTPGPALKYETDRRVYRQGDMVRITVTNVSNVATPIVNRSVVDGGFAVLEIKTEEGQWKPVELVAASDVHTFRSLGPGEHHEYVLQTTREARGDVAALPGTYRIGFGRPFYTHPFEIIDK